LFFGYSIEKQANLSPVTIYDDSQLDLVIANYYCNSKSIFLGIGTDIFVVTSPATYATGGAGPIDTTIQHLNGNSKMDLAVSHQLGNNVTVYLGSGNCTFEQGNTYSSTGHKLQEVIAQG
jgi:hypothetical protein